MKKLAVVLSTVSILLLSACASHAPKGITPANLQLTGGNKLPLRPMPDTWYITGAVTDTQELKGLCRDGCLPIVISERENAPGMGTVVFINKNDIPALLLALGSAKPQDLVGKKVTLDDEKNPAIAHIVLQGRACSTQQRINPLIEGKDWC